MSPSVAPADAGLTHDDVAALMVKFRNLNPVLRTDASLLQRIRQLETDNTLKGREITKHCVSIRQHTSAYVELSQGDDTVRGRLGVVVSRLETVMGLLLVEGRRREGGGRTTGRLAVKEATEL